MFKGSWCASKLHSNYLKLFRLWCGVHQRLRRNWIWIHPKSGEVQLMHLWSPHAETQVENLVHMAKLCSGSSMMLKNITRPPEHQTHQKLGKLKTLTRKLMSAAILCVHGGWRLDFLSTSAGTGKSKMKSLPHTAPKLEEPAILISTFLHQLPIKKLTYYNYLPRHLPSCHWDGNGMEEPLTILWPLQQVGRLWSGLSGRSKCQLKVSLDS